MCLIQRYVAHFVSQCAADMYLLYSANNVLHYKEAVNINLRKFEMHGLKGKKTV